MAATGPRAYEVRGPGPVQPVTRRYVVSNGTEERTSPGDSQPAAPVQQTVGPVRRRSNMSDSLPRSNRGFLQPRPVQQPRQSGAEKLGPSLGSGPERSLVTVTDSMFVVMCLDDVEIRSDPTYSDEARTGEFLSPGQCTAIDHKIVAGGVVFLRLSDGRGWVFSAKDQLLVMTEAHDYSRGLWHYNVVCEEDAETRAAPTFSDTHRTGEFVHSGDCVAVDERCRIAGGRFCKLADGRGWVFESKDGLLVLSEVKGMRRAARDFERGLWHYTVICDDDVEVRAAPTYSDEARTGQFLCPGDVVAIDERCRIGGIWFLKLCDGRGWVFESKDRISVMANME